MEVAHQKERRKSGILCHGHPQGHLRNLGSDCRRNAGAGLRQFDFAVFMTQHEGRMPPILGWPDLQEEASEAVAMDQRLPRRRADLDLRDRFPPPKTPWQLKAKEEKTLSKTGQDSLKQRCCPQLSWLQTISTETARRVPPKRCSGFWASKLAFWIVC